MSGTEECAFGAPHQNLFNFRCSAFPTHPYWVYRNAVAGIFGAEVYAVGAPRQNPTDFGIVHFKFAHTRYPKALLLAYLVRTYVRLGRHVETPQFLALSNSNTPILGIQKHSGWHIWCKGICVWGATSTPHDFWHCPFQTHPY